MAFDETSAQLVRENRELKVQVETLAGLLKRCARCLPPDHGTRKVATDYMRQHGLMSPLRTPADGVKAGAPGSTDAERAAWLADKIVAQGDYAKEAAAMLRRWPAGVNACLSRDGRPNHCVLWKCHESKACARGVRAPRGPLTLPEIAKMLAEVGADPDQPGEWQLEFVRRIEAAHGVLASREPQGENHG